VPEITADVMVNVWKVVAAPGDTVEPGDTLVILESMKMEIPVVTDDAAVITEMRVAEGGVVSEGDVIAIVG
jgi:acetyl-CoA carboxylase biotin carboxyl carrier protein